MSALRSAGVHLLLSDTNELSAIYFVLTDDLLPGTTVDHKFVRLLYR